MPDNDLIYLDISQRHDMTQNIVDYHDLLTKHWLCM